MRTFREHESKESALKSIINSQESKKIRQGRAVSPLKLGSELVRSFVSQTGRRSVFLFLLLFLFFFFLCVLFICLFEPRDRLHKNPPSGRQKGQY